MALQALSVWVARLAGRSSLSPADVEALHALPCIAEEYGTRGDIVAVGEFTTRACIVVSGLVGRIELLAEGARQITALYRRGDMPDLLSVVIPKATTGLQALCPTVVLRIPHSALKRLNETHPATTTAFWRECAIDASIAHAWVLNIGQRQAVERVAHLACEMAARDGGSQGANAFSFGLEITQGQLADATGMSVVHVNRALRVLRERELLIKSASEIQVLDWKGLQRMAQFDPTYLHLVPEEVSERTIGRAH